MKNTIKKVVVTGGAGQIAYSLLFRIAAGDMLGYDQPLILTIVDVPEAQKMLEGVKMELEDCAFPLLKEIQIGSDPIEMFKDANYALLVGAKPRGPGMERGDLLNDNGKIFVEQGKALNTSADPNVIVLIVGNPCNTNCLIAMSNAPKIPKKNFHAMTRLDQNRATAQLALKANVSLAEIKNLCIWGNHSSTQVPDFLNAKIQDHPVSDIINDQNWLKTTFIETIQKRGAAIINARGKSSAASAANAAIDAMKAIIHPTKPGEWFSSGVISDHNPYGIDKGLIFSFPCRSKGNGDYEIVKDLPWNEFLAEKIKKSERELIEERELVIEMLKNK